MAKTFRPYEPDQLLLMPPALADWVPEDHLARFVSDLVESLDLTAGPARRRTAGRVGPPRESAAEDPRSQGGAGGRGA
jgi:hypothetical protein